MQSLRRSWLSTVGLATAIASVALAGSSAASLAGSEDPLPAITYETRFVNPGPNGEADPTIEQYVIDRIDEAQPGTRIGFAVRDWTVVEVANAIRRAVDRGVEVIGVIDGGERDRPFLKDLVTALDGRAIFCGSPDYTFNSCLSNVLEPGLMHNKFWLFSQLPDGSQDVVVQTSQNWMPSQRTQFQDLVRINNDTGLYNAYSAYLTDMHAQAPRTDDYYRVASGNDGRNTMYPMPRHQADIWTDDVIVDRLDEVQCTSGRLVRVAQAFFRRARMAIADKLVALERQGCDVEVVNSNGDPEIVAALVNAGVRYYPLYLGLTGVQTHTKYWLVDAESTVTGARTKLVYAGSDNWRADEQQTDDMLVRIRQDGVYDAYASHWEAMKARSAFARKRAPSVLVDPEPPATDIAAVPAGDAGASEVTLRITGSDGVGDYTEGNATRNTTGVKRLHVEVKSDESETAGFAQDVNGAPYTAALTQTVTVSGPGTTTVTAYSEDHKGNVGSAVKYVVINRDEGATLTTGGAFTQAGVTLRKISGAGSVSDNGDGTWTWTHTPPDDGSGSVVVQASDGHDFRATQALHWHAANIAPVIDQPVVHVPAGAACQGKGNRVDISFTVADAADEAHDPTTGVIEWGDGSTDGASGRSVSASHLYAPGTYSPTISVSDGDGGTDSTQLTGRVSLLYAMTGILPPFGSDGTRVFKYGSTIPVKVRIIDCAGSPVPDLAPAVATRRRSGDTPVGEQHDATPMRYDPDGHYIYNLASGNLTEGPTTYFVYVREPHALGSDSRGNPTPGESSQMLGLR